jgi:ATP-dependent helicase/nuclease subunit A
MLILTRNLLINKPEIAKIISEQYSNIMVDEFQDTNSIQYDIIQALIPMINCKNCNFLEKNLSKKPNLFIVGDEKQSIYRFRNADVAVFNQAKNEIRQANEKFLKNDLEKSKIPKAGIINLSATFRMLPAITAFVNKICQNIYLNNQEYNDLICGRNSQEFLSKVVDNSELTEDFGNIKFLISVKEKNENLVQEDFENQSEKNSKAEEINPENENDTIEEAELLAKYINKIVNEGRNFSEIAILFRSRTKLNNLTFELIKHKIPFIVTKGVGFFSKQEIYDLISFLQFLNNPKDDLALLGVMFSPFFCFDNFDVININSENGNNLWEKTIKFCQNYSDEKTNYSIKKLQFLHEELNKLIEIAPILSIPHLIRTILNIGSWLSNLIDNPEENQILNNIEKFISIARDFQNRGFSSLNDFILELEILSEIEQESEADEQRNENSVSLQTIHSAKGLEFPVVILYNFNSQNQTIKLPILNKKYGIAFDVPKNDENIEEKAAKIDENPNERVKNLAGFLAAEDEKKAEFAENIRLLYVAMTRAKDCLIISANLEKNKAESASGIFKKSNSFFKMISESLNLTDEKLNQLIYNEDNNYFPIEAKLKLLNENENQNFTEKNISINCEIITKANLKLNSKAEKFTENELNFENSDLKNNSKAANEKIIISSEIPIVTEKKRFFSFSELSKHKKISENDKFSQVENIKNILGFKNFNLDLGISGFENILESVSNGSNKGNIYHNVLQKINEWFYEKAGNFEIDEENLSVIIKNEFSKIENKANLNEDDFFAKFCEITNTKLLQSYKNQFQNAKFEHKLYISFKENFYSGVIDCLIPDENGNFEIWDWKSNRIGNRANFAKLKETYSLQMRMYIYFLMHLFPHQDKFTARLLFTELAKNDAKNADWVVDFHFSLADKNSIFALIEKNIEQNLLTIR